MGFLLPTPLLAVGTITSISPSTVQVQQTELTLTITGTGFTDTDKVYVNRTALSNGIEKNPRFISTNTLEVNLTPFRAGESKIAVKDAAGNFSNEFTVRINGGDSTLETLRTIASAITSPGNLVLFIMIHVQKLYGFVFYWIARAAYELFKISIKLLIENDSLSITRNPAFLAVWNQVKGYANMLIVLELVAAAVMMILNLWKENAKKIIMWIIIIALIVNFSILICGLLIDLSNIIMKSLIGDGNNFNIIETIDQSRNRFVVGSNGQQPIFRYTDATGAVDMVNAAKYLAVEFIFNIMYLSTTFVFLYFIFILIQRYIYLAFLFIVSPLAFALWAFPKTDHFFGTWWSHFWKNCFIGIGAAFCIHLAFKVLQTTTNFAANATNLNTGVDALFSVNDLISIANVFFLFAIVMGFLFYGLRMTAKTAGPIGDMVMGAVAALTVAVVEAIATGGASLSTSMGGLAAKAVDVGTKGLGKASEAVTGSDALSKKFGDSKVMQGGMEWMKAGLSGKAGELEALNKKQQEEKLADPRKRYGAISDVDRLVKALEGTRDKVEQAAITERLKQLNAVTAITSFGGKTGKEAQRAAMDNAINRGVDANKVTDADNVDLNEAVIKENMRRYGIGENEAIARARKDLYARYDDSDLKKMSDEDIAKLAAEESDRGAKAMQIAIQRKIMNKVKDSFGGDEKTMALKIFKDSNKYGSSAAKDARELDYNLAKYNIERVNEVIAANIKGVGSNPKRAEQYVIMEQLRENLDKMPDKQLRKMDISELTPEILREFNGKQIRAFRTADAATRNHVRNASATALRADYNEARRLGDKAEMSRIKRLIKELAKLSK